uniref:Small ribosomal subunit protein uS7 n=1 Tax=Pan troglodytes TaxID=9598 RepID=A0A2I3SXS9_PANTR
MTEWETAAPAVAETPDIKLFGKWSTDDVHISDISLQDYIAYLPHSAGWYAAKCFHKAQCPIVERLTNSMMMHGCNNGKKLMTVCIVKHAFEVIHLLTGENPLQVLVNAIINSGPREDSTRIGCAGTVRRQAVDVSPLRRVNQGSSNSYAIKKKDDTAKQNKTKHKKTTNYSLRTRMQALTRHQICWCLDLGIPSLQNCEK